ncbi:hypothetical protein KC19_4G071200 [Ceratodon purpureus]|uniref:Uncharacterized protein n=1 Tax=Ceratodon purpureus TaxID=3225 RepID=A0A8T0I9C9_CERPU|nr:hypothetical protein KC19_4G071200 [Ceratodon purpureus]
MLNQLSSVIIENIKIIIAFMRFMWSNKQAQHGDGIGLDSVRNCNQLLQGEILQIPLHRFDMRCFPRHLHMTML